MTDKIVRRMKQIKDSSCSFDYKFNSLVILYEYLRELGPENNIEANILLGKMVCKKVAIDMLLFIFFLPILLPNIVFYFAKIYDGTPKEHIYFINNENRPFSSLWHRFFIYLSKRNF